MSDDTEPLTIGEFRDMLGRVWSVDCTPAAVELVRAVHNIDLEQVAFDGIKEFRSDFVQLSELLPTLLAEQLAERGLSAEALLDEMDAETAAAAAEAIARSLVENYPAAGRPELRQKLSRVITAVRNLEEIDAELRFSPVRFPEWIGRCPR